MFASAWVFHWELLFPCRYRELRGRMGLLIPISVLAVFSPFPYTQPLLLSQGRLEGVSVRTLVQTLALKAFLRFLCGLIWLLPLKEQFLQTWFSICQTTKATRTFCNQRFSVLQKWVIRIYSISIYFWNQAFLMITNTSYCLIMYQTSKHLSHTGRTRSSHCVHKGSRTATRSYRACWDHRATGSEPVGSRPQRPCSLMDADPLELGQQEPRRGCRGPVCTGGHMSSIPSFSAHYSSPPPDPGQLQISPTAY